MDSIYTWMQNNIGFVFLVYGLAFVVMGVAISAQPRKGSRFKLANIFWLLVAYAIIHAPADFMDMWNAMKGRNELLFQTGQILTYISYCFLFEFGRRLLGLYKQIIRWWVLPFVISGIFMVSVLSGNFWVYANVLIGYFVRFPAGLMSGLGFFMYYSRERKYLEQLKVKKYFYLTGASLLAWSFFCGIVRAKASFCPINTEVFYHTVKIPVHFFRMICALIATYGIVGILKIFDWETTTAIMQTNIQLEQRVAERTADLEQTVNKLNEANDELESFVNIASHDLREPLRKIISFASILKKSLQGKISSDDAENLAFVIEGTNRMTQIVGGLLAYLRIIVKTQSAENVDINKIAAQLEQFELGVLLKEKNATIEIPFSLPVVKADPAQIRQLMQHLIINGIKYQKKGSIPKITITSKPAAGGMVRIEVADNGIGIKPEYHQAIFNMFKQLHSHGEYEGAGVGLTVCKKIVELHGGEIGVESQPDKGSTFWFTMPAAEKLTIAATEVESHV